MTTTIHTHMIPSNGLHFEVHSCGKGQQLALCLHGFPCHAFSWRHQLPMLAQQGYQAWAPNLRGYGRSSRPPQTQDYHIDHLLNDIDGIIHYAKQHQQVTSVVLLGHDWGGLIAWLYALSRPKQIERLVICNVPHPKRLREGLKQWPQALKSIYVNYFQLPWLPEWIMTLKQASAIGKTYTATCCDQSRFPDSVLSVYQQNALQPGAMTAMLNYYRANYSLFKGPATETYQNLIDQKLLLPTLMLWGEQDVAFNKSLTEGTQDLVDKLTLHYFPNASHWLLEERHEQVNPLLANWLSETQSHYLTPDR